MIPEISTDDKEALRLVSLGIKVWKFIKKYKWAWPIITTSISWCWVQYIKVHNLEKELPQMQDSLKILYNQVSLQRGICNEDAAYFRKRDSIYKKEIKDIYDHKVPYGKWGNLNY